MDNYNDYYETNICSKLKEIDLFVKIELYNKTTNPKIVALLLNLSLDEIHNILKKQSIKKIDRLTFFHIMLEGSSHICSLYKRQLKIGYKNTYLPSDISYIYSIPASKIKSAMYNAGIDYITNENLHTVFKYIPLDHTIAN